MIEKILRDGSVKLNVIADKYNDKIIELLKNETI